MLYKHFEASVMRANKWHRLRFSYQFQNTGPGFRLLCNCVPMHFITRGTIVNYTAGNCKNFTFKRNMYVNIPARRLI